MKSYPSIKRFREDRHKDFLGETFAKLDGSNLRFEWESQTGWFRFGSRRRLLETAHPEFGCAMKMFLDDLAEPFEKLATDQKWSSIMVYCEFWGKESFAGEHEPDDPKFLTPIDLAIHKRGLMSPVDFVRQFNDLFDLQYLGTRRWDEDFVTAVQRSQLPDMAFEGVVGKNGTGHQRLAIKLKSNLWIEKVMQKYGTEKGTRLVNS